MKETVLLSIVNKKPEYIIIVNAIQNQQLLFSAMALNKMR